MKALVKVPVGWARTTLGDVLPLTYGKGLVEAQRDGYGDVPVYGSSGVVGLHSQALTHGPTLVVGRKGSVGAVHYSHVPCWPIDTTYFAEATPATNLRFFLYQLTWLQLGQLDKSTTIPGLSRDDYNATEVAIPPLPEQRRIVDAIEQQFTRLDAGVAALKRTRAALKRYRAAVLTAAVEGKLTEAWRAADPDVEPASKLLERILAERRAKWEADLRAKGKDPSKAKYDEPQGPDTTDLPEVPEGWCWATVEQLGPSGRPCAYGVLQPGPDINDGVPMVRVGDINDGLVDITGLKRIASHIANQYPRTTLQGEELLITLVGSIGRTAIVPIELAGANTARAVGVVPLSPLVYAPWVEIWFRNPTKTAEMTAKAHEVARKTLNLEDVRVATVALPPIDEQEVIVSEVEQRLSVVSELEVTVEHNLKRAERLRQSILERAFSGQLVPQDPNDEPAGVLLERIRREKSAAVVIPASAKKSNGHELHREGVFGTADEHAPEGAQRNGSNPHQNELWDPKPLTSREQ